MKCFACLTLCLFMALSALAQTCPPPNDQDPYVSDPSLSPIVINFGTGSYALTGADEPVAFDIRATGQPLRIGWTAAGADEAFLALDRNGNGQIDSGAELFGNATPLQNGQRAANGFLALLQYDDNHDGVIDEKDAIWSLLVLWRDQNHDGVSQPWEITPVRDSALKAISLRYHWAGRRDASGNMFRYESQVLIANGDGKPTPRPVYDIFFVPVP